MSNKRRPSADAEALAGRLREARLARGLLLREVGAPFSITPQSVGGWERAETRPDQDRLPELADLLGVNLEWLMRGQGPRDALHPRRGAYPGRTLEVREVVEADGRHRLAPTPRRETCVWPAGPRAWIVNAWDDAMSPIVPQGARLVIDPDPAPRRGSIVILRVIADDHLILRAIEQLSSGGRSMICLRASSDFYPMIERTGTLADLSGEIEMMGVAVEVCVERPIAL